MSKSGGVYWTGIALAAVWKPTVEIPLATCDWFGASSGGLLGERLSGNRRHAYPRQSDRSALLLDGVG